MRRPLQLRRSVGLKQINDPRCLKDGYPALDRPDVFPDLIRNVRIVQHLCGARSDGNHKLPECREVVNRLQAPHVSLKIGLHIIGVIGTPVQFGILHFRIAAAMDDLPKVPRISCGLCARLHILIGRHNALCKAIAQNLPQGKSVHLQNAYASGKRFAHTLHELIRLRSGKTIKTLFPSLLVHGLLDESKKDRRVLHLVNRHRRRIELHERPRILLGLIFDERVIQRHITSVRQHLGNHRRLTDLPGPRDQYSIVCLDRFHQQSIHEPGNVHQTSDRRFLI